MACLAPRESHAARADRQGENEVGRGCRSTPTAVFRVVRARSAWGEEPEKVSRPLRGARRRATLRVQGAPGRVLRSKGRRRAAWNRAWSPGPPGMGRGPSMAVAGPCGDWRRHHRGRDGAAFPSLDASVGNGTAFQRRSRRIRARDRWLWGGSPCRTATVLRNTSVGRRRQADVELRREG